MHASHRDDTFFVYGILSGTGYCTGYFGLCIAPVLVYILSLINREILWIMDVQYTMRISREIPTIHLEGVSCYIVPCAACMSSLSQMRQGTEYLDLIVFGSIVLYSRTVATVAVFQSRNVGIAGLRVCKGWWNSVRPFHLVYKVLTESVRSTHCLGSLCRKYVWYTADEMLVKTSLS